MLDHILTALGFLTTLPVRLRRPPEPGDLAKAAVWFPWVGLLIGLILAAGWRLFSMILPPLLTSALITGLWVILTGGLHLDGLADCCDGLFSAKAKERRLEIMRDSHVGAFGVLGLVLFLVIKFSAIYSLSAERILPALIAAPLLARFLLLPAGFVKSARQDGLGSQFLAGISRWGIILAAILPVIILGIAGWLYLAAGLFAALAAGGVILLAKSRIGGLTGDVLGMLVEVSELSFISVLCLAII